MEQQNIVEVQIRQILAVTLAFKTILPRFDVLAPSKVRVVSGGGGVWILSPQAPEPWSVVDNMNPGSLEVP